MSATVSDTEQVALLMSQILTNYTQMMVNFFDMFYNPEPMDLTLEMYDDEGNINTYTVPNRAKDREYILNGNGNPEGQLEAVMGSIYQDLNQGMLYIKTDDSLDTGWKEFISRKELDKFIRKGYGDPEGVRSGELGELYLDMSTASLFIKTTQSGNTGWSEFLRNDDNIYVKISAFQTVTNKTMDAENNNFINFTKANFKPEAIIDILSVPFAVNRGSMDATGHQNYLYYPLNELNNGCTIDGSLIRGGRNAYFIKDQTANFQLFSDWEMRITYTYAGGGQTPTIIGHALGASEYAMPRLFLENSVLKFQASSNGTSWDIANDLTMLNMISGVTYNLKVIYNENTGYFIYNGSNLIYSNNNTAKIKGREGLMLLNDGSDISNCYSLGSINFNTLRFFANGITIVDGSDFDKIQTRSGIGYDNLIISNASGTTVLVDSIKTLPVTSLANGTYNVFFDIETQELYAMNNKVHAGLVPPLEVQVGDIFIRQVTPMEVYQQTSQGPIQFNDIWLGNFVKENGNIKTVTPLLFNYNTMHVDSVTAIKEVRRSEYATDFRVPTEKAVATAIENYNDSGVIKLGNASGVTSLTKDKMHTATFVGNGSIKLPDAAELEADTHYNCSIIFNYISGVSVTQASNVVWSYSIAPILQSTTALYRITYETINKGESWYGYWTQIGT